MPDWSAALTGLLRLCWLSLPLTVGPLVTASADRPSTATTTALTVGLWAIWGATLLALLVPRTVTLTAVRIATPTAVAIGALGAVIGDDVALWQVGVGLGVTTLAVVTSLTALVGALFIDGSSYGPERRFALRPPLALYLGPIALAWAMAVAGALAGPVLLAHGRWVAGAGAAVVGLPLAWITVRALHTLARRWLVLVPGGIVIHDPYTLADPLLLPRSPLGRPRPAAGPDDAGGAPELADLSFGAAGLAVDLPLNRTVDYAVARRAASTPGELSTARVFRVVPTRPGRFITTQEASAPTLN